MPSFPLALARARAVAAVVLLSALLPLLVVANPAPAAASTAFGQAVVAEAARHAGAPYVYGATGPSTFDCSGFTGYVYRRLGVSLPRTSSQQAAAAPRVPNDQKDLGDLIFFYNSGGVYHVGIYAGNNTMWAAPHTGDVVRQQTIYSSSYFVGRPVGALAVAPPPPPPTLIQAHWLALGGAGGPLGSPVTGEIRTPDGAGFYTAYSRNASIYWTPGTGARAVVGAIRSSWGSVGWERGALGYPTTDEVVTPNGRGRYNHFNGGGGASVYWTPQNGAQPVYGAIRSTWGSLGWESGALGFPTTGEQATPDGRGRYNHFEGGGYGGSVYWTPQTGSHAVLGSNRATWAALGWERGTLGYPVTNELRTPDGVGRYNHFDGRGNGASVYWTPATGSHAVVGAIRAAWAAAGWERSALGYPTSDEYGTPDGQRRSNFAHGYISYDPRTNGTAVHAG